MLCAGNNCIHVHEYVSVHIIVRSKLRFGTRGIAFVLTLSWAAAQYCATGAIMPLILPFRFLESTTHCSEETFVCLSNSPKLT